MLKVAMSSARFFRLGASGNRVQSKRGLHPTARSVLLMRFSWLHVLKVNVAINFDVHRQVSLPFGINPRVSI
jgi:hypothetical protein